ncbi:uncharacterized protein LOC111700613 [Eurytemora carolleeae]|uniref:uncharacterized protein LOC111700613 n=1 Tax=Eurytemora carolleeae TaxID=1294199 RepID=UPI000C77C0CD|nr:uncharacterized protein LOC111700613 [Eurytemora carolleeae]XP_023327354.1 uncharacterized protein LOC111700613 [Eurytemora carolleeae]|eukprot:XP_023327353.1 uncharacterized protein LOC111700613 [Eurytemora affinis]
MVLCSTPGSGNFNAQPFLDIRDGDDVQNKLKFESNKPRSHGRETEQHKSEVLEDQNLSEAAGRLLEKLEAEQEMLDLWRMGEEDEEEVEKETDFLQRDSNYGSFYDHSLPHELQYQSRDQQHLPPHRQYHQDQQQFHHYHHLYQESLLLQFQNPRERKISENLFIMDA